MEDFWRVLLVVLISGTVGAVVFGPLGARWEWKGPSQEERIAADKARRLARSQDRARRRKGESPERLTNGESPGVGGHDGSGPTAPH